MTAEKSMDMELTPLDLSFLDEEPLNSSVILADHMDNGTLGNWSEAFLPNEICKHSDLFLFNPTPSLNTVTNRESISSSSLPSEPFPYAPDSALGFPFDGKLYSPPLSSPAYPDDFYSHTINKYFTEEQEFPALFSGGNFMKSPLSSEEVDSILDTASISDDGDISSSSPLGSPPDSPGSQVTLAYGEVSHCDSPASTEGLLTLTLIPPVSSSPPCEDAPSPFSRLPAACSPSPPPSYGGGVVSIPSPLLSGKLTPTPGSPSYYEDVPYYSPPPPSSSSSPPPPPSPSPSSFKDDDDDNSNNNNNNNDPLYITLSPSSLHLFSVVDESDGNHAPSSCQTSVLDVALGFAAAGEAPSSSSSSLSSSSLALLPHGRGGVGVGVSPCSLVSSAGGRVGGGKEKKTKSFRTSKKSPYARAGASTESTPSSPTTTTTTDNDYDSDPDEVLEEDQAETTQAKTTTKKNKMTIAVASTAMTPHQSCPNPNATLTLTKKEKKKIQNKNAATRYRTKMKEEAELRKTEEDGLFDENCRLKRKVEDIQKEIQYLKNLLQEIGAVRTTSTTIATHAKPTPTVVVVTPASAVAHGRRR